MKSAKLSEYFMPTLREDPREAEIASHRLMVRSAMIRKLASGIYEFLPLGCRVLKKVENIIRREMEKINGQEILMSALQPRELWDSSGRWDLYGPELLRLKDRKERDFCLGPTHEEVITSLVGGDLKSYRQLPLVLYQFQMKFRDEIRPRFGLMRAREFYMKDAYSFDRNEKECVKSYKKHVEAYRKIFSGCGLEYKVVEAAAGNIGGHTSHEFMVTSSSGEDRIVVCENKGCPVKYSANVEKASYLRPEPGAQDEGEVQLPLEEIDTPGMKSVEEVSEFTGQPPSKFIKTLIYNSEKGPVAALIRGDHELNLEHLKKYAGVRELEAADEETVKELTGSPPGFAGPVNIKVSGLFKMLGDKSLKDIKNALSGANKKDCHLKNINYGRDYSLADSGLKDLRVVTEGDGCPECGETLVFKRGIEVGHTFLLGNKYSRAMGAKFTDSDGREKDMVMGCYGIGVSRVVAAAIEQSHDEKGIVWPLPLAPFHIHIIQIGEENNQYSLKLFRELSGEYEVLLDDRKESPGIKFNDALLIGCPAAIVVGRKYSQEGKVEIQERKSGKSISVLASEVKEKLDRILKKN